MPRRARKLMTLIVVAAAIGVALLAAGRLGAQPDDRSRLQVRAPSSPVDRAWLRNAASSLLEGQRIFRYDTFGDEAFWTDSLRLHEAIPSVSPATALAVGLKVDREAVPSGVLGQLDPDDPAFTLELLRRDAVVGVTGGFDESGNLSSIGIQCALCHSTVDDSVTAGIGYRLDGWPNRDLDVGTIISLAPDLSAIAALLETDQQTVRSVLQSWGPGKFDAHLLLDGKAFRPDGESAATLIPPAYGLAGVNLQTFTGWGSTAHWNALVATIEMGGRGTLYEPRLNDPDKFPVAARAGLYELRSEPDLVTSKLAALNQYQLSLAPPPPPFGSFNAAAAERGRELFAGKADCARCHVPPLYTEPGFNLHSAEEIGIDDFQAMRSPAEGYRTAPLAGLWARAKGGYYHDGRFANLEEVVRHYDSHFGLQLTDEEVANLVEFLSSL